jgi:hypothetical protein
MASAVFSGLCFHLKGRLGQPHQQLKDLIRANGGELVQKTEDCDFLVVGENTKGKTREKHKAGNPVIITTDFVLQSIKQGTLLPKPSPSHTITREKRHTPDADDG